MTNERKHEPRRDPEPSEIEVDEANEEFGGPTTESLESGLSSSLQPGGTIPGGGPGTGQGSIGAGGRSTAGGATGTTGSKQV